MSLYSPKIKQVVSAFYKTWQYTPKYTLDPNLEAIYDGVFCPEISMTAPSLRDVLSQIMIVKDCIPLCENNVIKALDISKRNGAFLTPPARQVLFLGVWVVKVIQRAYGASIAGQYRKKTPAHGEYLGFRNSIRLGDFWYLQLETRFPIYKINNKCAITSE